MAQQQTGSYHHGNLRAALVDAGLALVRIGGPDALSLREVTRAVGVTPSAAYRHFANRQGLLGAVAVAVQDRMADAMLERWPDGTGAEAARARLRAVGTGYIAFAQSEPGWFAAFFAPEDASPDGGTHLTDRAPPFVLLTQALDSMVEAGALTPASRQGAEWPCWSAVHGFAHLASTGPLRHLSGPEQDALALATVETIIEGICARS
ncbi:TetR/AcrR family transcriptional regulator [Ruania halotolerans]|uniref:TetR/AcrR family transcriptional regulator n=1 Tax=Ruania halotolerans TaxID=2897773 RepID=UPI001E4A8289|nr:TetR/AcrR family transcriptional regulator [Ruania halotolerans]UFU08044.1 TetR/AcrR family transcriptional regulator [Ruania halotolerans]